MLDKLKPINDKLFRKSYSQIIIDLIDNFDIEYDEYYHNGSITELIGSYKYHVSCIKEVYNPALVDDIELLNEFEEFLNSK